MVGDTFIIRVLPHGGDTFIIRVFPHGGGYFYY